MEKKVKVGVFKLTSCAGCQMVIVHLEDVLLEINKYASFEYFKMATSKNEEMRPVDIALVEGAVTTSEEIKELKKVRENSKVLVAVGSCATIGGIPSMKNELQQTELEKYVYKSIMSLASVKAYGLSEYITVDAYLYGCPIESEEFLQLMSNLLAGISPRFPAPTVCKECKIKGNRCLLVGEGKACLGPVTRAGCDALCPSNGYSCTGCRGPSLDPNPKALMKVLLDKGFSQEEIKKLFKLYNSQVPEFMEVTA
jgi:coenzyme F420-reducing hydrogenase gamma subunit